MPCPLGKYGNSAGLSFSDFCVSCVPGKYQKPGLSFHMACTKCEPNTFSNVTGASVCLQCKDGTTRAVKVRRTVLLVRQENICLNFLKALVACLVLKAQLRFLGKPNAVNVLKESMPTTKTQNVFFALLENMAT